MASRQCSYETCVDPEEIGCNLGFELTQCNHWKKGEQKDKGRAKVATDIANVLGDAELRLRLPWTGNSLGTSDVGLITGCAPTTVIGVIGPFNAGKTTLLTLFYLLLLRGEKLTVGTFAGSLSFAGWNNLAAKLRWLSDSAGPMFPPHTSRGAGRRPGLLHVAFRGCGDIKQEFLLTDPPGEWFGLWAEKDNAEGAEGARWVARYADRFLFLVDREVLSSPERGKARQDLMDLARRLAPQLRGRPIAVVWTKSDCPINAGYEDDLRECFSEEFVSHIEFSVRMRFGNEETRMDVEDPCLALMDWIFSPLPRPSPVPFFLPVNDPTDLFLSYRGNGNQAEDHDV